MKTVLFEITGDQTVLAGTVLSGCLGCGADVAYDRAAPEGTSIPIVCDACGEETEMKRVTATKAAVRRPYGCGRWARVPRSSNVSALGVLRGDLLVRFHSGGVYRYAGAAGVFDDLRRADSVGKAFHRGVRNRFPAERLCAGYGCARPAKVSSNQTMCSECLHPDRPSE